MKSLGIDVGVKKGHHLVGLNNRLEVILVESRVSLHRVSEVCARYHLDVVAVDSPPCWPTSGGRRTAERQLQSRGIQLFVTPWDRRKHNLPFYRWMKEGFKVFNLLGRLGFPRHCGAAVRHTTIEVFPYASAAFLTGSLRPQGVSKVRWRRRILAGQGVAAVKFGNVDLVDAALAALTGLYALRGDYHAFGDQEDGFIVILTKAAANISLQQVAPQSNPGHDARAKGESHIRQSGPERRC